MAFTIIWSEKAISQVESLPVPIRKAIYAKVGELGENPYGGAVRKLRGTGAFRLRVGDYRVIFDVSSAELRVLVLFLGHRKNVYKRFGL